MRYFSQHDPKFKKIKLGTSNDTVFNSGCALVSISNITDNDPEFLNNFFVTTGVFSNGNMIDFSKAASRLGYTYKKQLNNPKIKCVAETAHFKSKGVSQHFFLLKPDNSIIDPLDYPIEFKKNPYKIVSYRIFNKINNSKSNEIEQLTNVNQPILPNGKNGQSYAETPETMQTYAGGFEKQEDGTITTTLNPIPTSDSTTGEVQSDYHIIEPEQITGYDKTTGLIITNKNMENVNEDWLKKLGRIFWEWFNRIFN